MCFRSVLVQLSSDNSCLQRLTWADSLAHHDNSRVHGVYFQSELATMPENTADLILAPEGVAYVPDAAKNSKSLVKEDLQNLRSLLKEKAGKDEEFHWFTVPGNLQEQLSIVSLTHDLVILSRSWFDGFDQVKLKSLLPDFKQPLSAPVMVMPEHVPENAFFNAPILVWDNSVEASRTLKSALPLLKRSGQAGILCDFQGSEEYDIVALEEVASYLESHDVRITSVHSAPDDKSLPAAIESVVQQDNYDLVISGVKQGSVLHNMVYGKQLEQLLNNLTVPLFACN